MGASDSSAESWAAPPNDSWWPAAACTRVGCRAVEISGAKFVRRHHPGFAVGITPERSLRRQPKAGPSGSTLRNALIVTRSWFTSSSCWPRSRPAAGTPVEVAEVNWLDQRDAGFRIFGKTPRPHAEQPTSAPAVRRRAKLPAGNLADRPRAVGDGRPSRGTSATGLKWAAACSRDGTRRGSK